MRRHRRSSTPRFSAAAAVVAVVAGFQFADARARHRVEESQASQIRGLLDENWNDHLSDVVAGRKLWLELHARSGALPAELRDLVQQLSARFDADFDTRSKQLEEHLARGLGGSRDSDHFGGYAAPFSQADLSLFQRDSEWMHAIYGDRPDVASVTDLDRAEPHVSLHLDAATAAAAAGAPAHASMRAIDPLLGTRGEVQSLGDLPITDRAVPQGNWRFVVEIPGFGFAEYTRYLVPSKETIDLTIRVRRSEEASAGMKSIEAGRYTFDKKRPMGCDVGGPSADFEAFLIDEAEVSNGDFVRFLEETKRVPPYRWKLLGYKTDWHELPIGSLGDRFLDLPVAGICYGDAQAYAEWAGKRLGTHLELERGLRGPDGLLFPGGEPELPPAAENYNVYGRGTPATKDLAGDFDLYLANVLPVRDLRYRQPPEGLFHAFGNVAELSESLLAEPEAGVLVPKTHERVNFGAPWDAKEYRNSLSYHATSGVSERYTSMKVGIRCCKSRSP